MKIRVIKVFGHEVLRVETHEEITVSDIVRSMMEIHQGLHEEEEEEDEQLYYEAEEGDPCTYCGEPLTEDDIIDSRFSTMTERLVWDARTEDYPEDPDISSK